jgi:hypothetical protein
LSTSRVRALLAAPSSLGPTGRLRVRVPPHLDLVPRVEAYLRQRQLTEAPHPLGTLHRRVAPELQALTDGPLSKASTFVVPQTPAGVWNAYAELMGWVADEVLGTDLVFEASPSLRFHFPVPMPDAYRSPAGDILAQHSDTLLGDYFEQINGWLALSPCYGTGALAMASLEDSLALLEEFASGFDYDETTYFSSRQRFFRHMLEDERFAQRVRSACRPLELEPGELVLFDARTVHGTAENVEDGTRVSMDFRLLRVGDYDQILEAQRAEGVDARVWGGDAQLKGGYFHAHTVAERRAAL